MVSVLIGALDVVACGGSLSKSRSGREIRRLCPRSHLQPTRSEQMAQTQEIDYDYFISESGRRWQPSASEPARFPLPPLETIGNRLCGVLLRQYPLQRSQKLSRIQCTRC